jgi:hypothetical protein
LGLIFDMAASLATGGGQSYPKGFGMAVFLGGGAQAASLGLTRRSG